MSSGVLFLSRNFVVFFSSLCAYKWSSCVGMNEREFLVETFANVYHRYALPSPSFTSTIVIIWLFPVGFQNNCTLRFVSRHIFLSRIVRSFSRVPKVKCECFWIHTYLEINSGKYLGKTEFRITSDNIFCIKMKSWCFHKWWNTCERTKFNHRNKT